MKEYENAKIVVFIDDLDRCKPEKAREIFESIKIFLDIQGFVFVLGLSRETLDKIIEKWFEDIGLKGLRAQEYIQKIIQIEINIPKWHRDAIYDLITKIVNQRKILDIVASSDAFSSSSITNIATQDATKIIDLLVKIVEQNPRQTKRLLNNFILAKTANSQLNGITYFLQEAIKKRRNFFENINIPSNRNYLIDFLKDNGNRDERNIKLAEIKKIKSPDPNQKFLLEIEGEMWDLINDGYYEKYFNNLLRNWDVYRIVSESVSRQSVSDMKGFDESAYQLLDDGNVPAYNKLKLEYKRNSMIMNLKGVNLANAEIAFADLSGADLSGADLSGADLSVANLKNANLIDVDLSEADLTRANLTNANLSNADLQDAILPTAKLSSAILPGAILSGADLSGAVLSFAAVFDAELLETKLPNSDLKKAILSNSDLSGTTLSNADLKDADLSGANLEDVNLTGANLSGADLTGANLSGADLTGANLSSAQLKQTIIIGTRFSTRTIFQGADLRYIITDDSKFIDHIRKFSKKVPVKIENKRELKSKLEQKELSKFSAEDILAISKLPE